MEPLTLVTTAVTLAIPFLIKTGEKIAERIGEDIWQLLKKPFTKNNDALLIDINNPKEKDKLISLLLEEISNNADFKKEIEVSVDNAQKELNTYSQQSINNNGKIDRQINIQNNNGNIQM